MGKLATKPFKADDDCKNAEQRREALEKKREEDYLNDQATRKKSYDHRDVLYTTNLMLLSQNEHQVDFENYFKNNIILTTPNVLNRTSQEIKTDFINITNSINEDSNNTTKYLWLTDYICPSFETSLKMHIFALLVINYKVSPKKLVTKCREIYSNISKEQLTTLNQDVNKKISKITTDLINSKAKDIIPKSINKNPAITNSINQIVTDRLTRDIIYQNTLSFLEKELPRLAELYNLKIKTTYKIGDNEDKILSGAPGSGKDSAFPIDTDKIYLSTDLCRSFVLLLDGAKDTNTFESSQDIAFMIKEVICNKLKDQKVKNLPRANIVQNGLYVTENELEGIIQFDKSDIYLIITTDIAKVVFRAHERAENEKAAPADKGRHVHTTRLLEGQSIDISKMVKALPENIIVEVQEVEEIFNNGQPSTLLDIATIDTKDKAITIKRLVKFAQFLNKQNVNTEATSREDLFCRGDKKAFEALKNNETKSEKLKDYKISPISYAFKQSICKAAQSLDGYTLKLMLNNDKKHSLEITNAAGKVKYTVTHNYQPQEPMEYILIKETKKAIITSQIEEIITEYVKKEYKVDVEIIKSQIKEITKDYVKKEYGVDIEKVRYIIENELSDIIFNIPKELKEYIPRAKELKKYIPSVKELIKEIIEEIIKEQNLIPINQINSYTSEKSTNDSTELEDQEGDTEPTGVNTEPTGVNTEYYEPVQ